jgi:hypothetical protein
MLPGESSILGSLLYTWTYLLSNIINLPTIGSKRSLKLRHDPIINYNDLRPFSSAVASS